MPNTDDKSKEKAIKSSYKNKSTYTLIQLNHLDRAVVFLCVICVTFKSHMELLLQKSDLIALISNFESNWQTNIIFFTTCLVLLYRAGARFSQFKYLTTRHVIYWCIPSIVLLHYRFRETNVWEFTGLYSFEQIKYIDIYFFQVSLIVIYKIILLFMYWFSDDDSPQAQGSRLLDNEIWNIDDDILKRLPFVKRVMKDINNFKQTSHSPILAIQAPWGAGKSSAIHLLEDQIKRTDNKAIVLTFNPWNFEDKSSISESFYTHLHNELGQYHSGIQTDLTSYFQSLININDPFISWCFHRLLIPKDQLFKDKKEAINRAIRKINRRVIVIIDDIDRLKPEEILEVFKLLRNNASFTNTLYVVAYDREYVMRSLHTAGVVNAEKYPDKIFDITHNLPIIYHNDIKSFLVKHITKRIDRKDKDIASNTIYSNNELQTVLIKNLRVAKKFINTFVELYNSLKGDVYIPNLLDITLLKVLYPGVFELIVAKPMVYLKNKRGIIILKAHLSDNEENPNSVIEKTLHDNYLAFSIDPMEIRHIIELLQRLFPNDTPPEHHDQICYLCRYKRYFAGELLEEDISNKDFANCLSSEVEIIETQLDVWIKQGKQYNLSIRLQKTAPEQFVDLTKLISAHLYFCMKYFILENKREESILFTRLHQLSSMTNQSNFLENYLSNLRPSPLVFNLLINELKSKKYTLLKKTADYLNIVTKLYSSILNKSFDKNFVLYFLSKSKEIMGSRSESIIIQYYGVIMKMTKKYIKEDIEKRLFILVNLKETNGEITWSINRTGFTMFKRGQINLLFESLADAQSVQGKELYEFWLEYNSRNQKPIKFTFKYNQNFYNYT